MFPTKEELKEAIKNSHDAVDESAFGPICQYQNNDFVNKQYNQLAFNVFVIVLTGVLRGIYEGSAKR